MNAPKITIAGYDIDRVGLGTMQLTGPKAMGEPADADVARKVLRNAVDDGVQLIDTSGYYGPEVANRLVAEALWPYPTDLLIATKVGARRTPDGGFMADATPDAVRIAVHDNLRQLRLEALPLVHARFMPDSTVPFEETVGALVELKEQGMVGDVGVSNVSVTQLERARSVAPIATVENEFRIGHADGRDVLDAAVALGVPYLAFRPLGNGSLLRSPSPLSPAASRLGVSPAALALAWILDQSDGLAVIPGTSSPGHLAQNLSARSISLDDDVRAELAGWSGHDGRVDCNFGGWGSQIRRTRRPDRH